jgi:hypothetical protein
MQAGQARYSGAFIDLLPTLLTYAGLLNNTVGVLVDLGSPICSRGAPTAFHAFQHQRVTCQLDV